MTSPQQHKSLHAMGIVRMLVAHANNPSATPQQLADICEHAKRLLEGGGIRRPRVFFDLDGVAVNFDGFKEARNLTVEEVKRMPGAYLMMSPVHDAIASIREVIAMGYEAWIASKPPTAVPGAYADKVSWVLMHIPELESRIILTHDKGLLGSPEDYLVDDRPDRANCREFQGTLIHFGGSIGWSEVVAILRANAPNLTVHDGMATANQTRDESTSELPA